MENHGEDVLPLVENATLRYGHIGKLDILSRHASNFSLFVLSAIEMLQLFRISNSFHGVLGFWGFGV